MISSPFQDIPLFGYDLIMADPPWSYENWSAAGEGKNAKAKYDCMTLDEICARPVGELASKDCLLWLWATNPMLDVAFDVIRAWGFQFKTSGTWSKKTKHGKIAFGTGYILRCASEPFLIATTGKITTAKNVRSLIEGPAREHSRKPDEAFAAAEQLIPNAKRIEIFSRQPREGWDVWGHEADKFEHILDVQEV